MRLMSAARESNESRSASRESNNSSDSDRYSLNSALSSIIPIATIAEFGLRIRVDGPHPQTPHNCFSENLNRKFSIRNPQSEFRNQGGLLLAGCSDGCVLVDFEVALDGVEYPVDELCSFEG